MTVCEVRLRLTQPHAIHRENNFVEWATHNQLSRGVLIERPSLELRAWRLIHVG